LGYRILALDGGGVRGVLTARLLERIVAERPDFLAGVDLFAGTSTGAILAIGLARGLTPADLVTLYRQRSKIIFHDTPLDNLRDLGNLAGARYGTARRREGISPYIGDVTLGDLLPRHVLVATFLLDSENPLAPAKTGPRTWKAKFYHNFEGPDSDAHEKAIDVVLRSTAAPTYFPIYQGFIDGGVVANNPSMCALAQALHPQTGKQQLENLVLLSLGTGARPRFISSRNGDWGLGQWGKNLIELLFDAGNGLADYQCRQLLGDAYLRVNPDLAEPIALDAVAQINRLVDAADAYLAQHLPALLAWIDARWMAAD
jgi:patatin-like phospholipase/acyl hydrolase